MKSNKVSTPLLFPVLGMVLGISVAYSSFSSTGFDTFQGLIIFSLLTLLFAWVQTKKRVFFRLAFITSVFFTLGFILFTLNDVRTISSKVSSNEEVYLVKLTNVKDQGLKGQLVQAEITAQKQGDKWKELKSVSANLFLYKPKRAFEPEEVLLIKCQLLPHEETVNPGAFDSKYYYTSQGVLYSAFVGSEGLEALSQEKTINYYIWITRQYFKKKIQETISGREAGVANALILGDKSLLDNSVVEAFTNTGTMHVLAVSGMHVGIILMILLFFLGLFSRFISKKQALVIALCLIWFYGLLTGASAAVMRSVVMFTILSSAHLFNKPVNNLNNLFLSAILLLAWNPWNLFDIGFQLSYAAMLGLFLFTNPIESIFKVKNKPLNFIWKGSAVGFAATVFTTPLILYWFHQFPNYFFLSNLGVLILGNALLFLGLLLLISVFSAVLLKTVAFLLGIVIFLLIYWVETIDAIPGAISNGFQLSGFHLFLCLICLILWILALERRKLIFLSSVYSIGLVILFSFGRYESNFANKCHLLDSDNIQFICSGEKTAYAFYEKENGNVIQRRDTLFAKEYERFTGIETKLILLKDSNSVSVSGKKFHINKVADGWLIKSELKSIFFRQSLYTTTPKHVDLVINRSKIQHQYGLAKQVFSFAY